MPTPTTVTPRKTPRQERARATVEAMIEATARILADEGADALTTNHVAQVAGVSIGSLYQYVPNKQALIALVMEVELERDRDAMIAMLRDAQAMTLDALLAHAIRANARRFYERAAIHRVILPLVTSVERRDTVRATVVELREAFISLLSSRPDELRPEYANPARLRTAALVVFASLEAVYNEAMCHDPDLLLGQDLCDHLLTLCRAILLRAPERS